MKLLKITTFNPSYLIRLYRKHPLLAEKSFTEQKTALDYDAFGWSDFWSTALTRLGFEVMEITYNVEPMQRAWARENSLSNPANADLKEIALAQVKKIKPDILWFDDSDENLLQRIRLETPSIRLVLGWVGSAIPKTNVWQQMNLVLSCAPESVEKLRKAGFKAEQLHHGFDPRINMRLQDRPKQLNFTFIGQLIRCDQYHLQREYLLEQLAKQSGIDIFSPSADLGWGDEAKALVMAGLYGSVKILKAAGVSEAILKNIPLVRRAVDLPSMPLRQVNPVLKPLLNPAVFGLEMFQVLRDSKIVLNIHADSSPSYASNMRLFETTGVASCLVTDWKENLAELFEPDKEVVAYKNPEECVEKVKWLLDHPQERENIAKAGQERTLRDHTYSLRALRLAEIIRTRLER